jgi:hypothetical protein
MNFAYKLTCPNFTKKSTGVSQNHRKHYFDPKKYKSEQKKILSTLLYEMFPLCNANSMQVKENLYFYEFSVIT